MRYEVSFQAMADAFARVYVEADSETEAQVKADAINRDLIEWEVEAVDPDTIEEVGICEKPPCARKITLAPIEGEQP